MNWKNVWNVMRYTPLGWFGGSSILINSLAGKTPWYYGALSKLGDATVGSIKSAGDSYTSIIGNLKNAVNQILTGDTFENLVKYLSHSGMTNEQRETMDLQLENQRLLNQEEYDRKIDFYERYESPQAVVNQYKSAGLNPMLLAGSGAGASASGGIGTPGSAGTSSPSGANPLDFLSSLMGVLNQQQRTKNDFALEAERNEIARYDAETRRLQSQDYVQYLRALTENKGVETDILKERWPAEKEQILSQTNYLRELATSETGRRALMASHIDVNTAQKALLVRQEAIAAAQEKYADKYFSAAASYEYYMSRLAETQNTFERRTLESRVKMVETQLTDMIISAGTDAKVFENFGQMNAREWIKTASQAIGALGGVAVGAGALGASNAFRAAGASFARFSPGSAVLSGSGQLFPNMFTPGFGI